MFLHLGRDVVVPAESIITIFDMDTATWSRHTRNYLTAAEQAGKVLVITDELPKAARDYVEMIEKAVGCPIKYVSVGAGRDEYIER